MSVNMLAAPLFSSGSINAFSHASGRTGSVQELSGSGLYLPGSSRLRVVSMPSGMGLFLPGQTGRGTSASMKKTVSGLQSLAAIQKAEMSAQRHADALAPNATENPLTSTLRAAKMRGKGLYIR